MPRVSLWFFAVAPLYAIIGMLWGMHMAQIGDHSLYPAHAHLNLLGWVTIAIYGTFYALAGDRVPARFAWTTFALANLGVLIMIPALAMLLAGGEDPNSPYVAPTVAGSVLTLLGMISFAVSVWMVLLKKKAR